MRFVSDYRPCPARRNPEISETVTARPDGYIAAPPVDNPENLRSSV
jgi:hypothetical protein